MTPATQRAVEAICQAHQAIIVEFNAQRLHIAVAETPSHTLMAELRFAAHCPIEVECWPKARLEQSHQREKLPDLAAAEDGPEHTGTAVEIINALLVQALQKRASDIHIEPQEGSLRLRLRVDGVLQHLPWPGWTTARR